MAKPQPKLPTETDRQLFRRNFPAFGYFGFCLMINVMLSWFFSFSSPGNPSGLPVYVSIGVVASEFVLLALLLILFPASLLFRIVIVLTGSVAVIMSLLLGAVVFHCSKVIELFPSDALTVDLLGCAVPFFFARHFLGWRLQFDSMETPEHPNLSVAGLMVATALVGVSISLLSFSDQHVLITKLMVAVGCMGAGFAVFMPLTYWVLKTRRKWAWLVLFSASPLLVGMAVTMAFGINLTIPHWGVIGLASSISSLILGIGIGLVALHHCGGRLLTV